MKKVGILFDMDGTLLNTLEDLTDAVNHILQENGCPTRTMEEIRSFVGNGARYLLQKSPPDGDDAPDVDVLLPAYQTYYAANAQVKTRPYDGILEALEEIRKEFPIAVVSNKPDRATKLLSKEYFGEDIFALGESDACPRKPAPDMVYQGMAAIGVDRCIYVGDSEVDIITAKNAGVPCLSVLWGFRDRQCLTENGATHFCEDPRDLPRCLKEMVAYGE